MQINEVHVAIFFGVISLVSALISWILNSKINTAILSHTKDTQAELETIRTKINANDSKNIEQLEKLKTAISTDLGGISQKVVELKVELTDKIFTVMDDRYVTKDLHNAAIVTISEKFLSLKDLLETHMERIEKNLERQITDLKERLLDK
jgi:hypothetical protein